MPVLHNFGEFLDALGAICRVAGEHELQRAAQPEDIETRIGGGATVGFGVRNLIDLAQGFREVARVLKPGARYVVLELSTPQDQPLRGTYLLYFRHLLPLIGRAVSKHTNAYSWLPESVLAFPEPDALSEVMEASGFDRVSHDLLFGGACAIHVGTKS